MTVLFCITCAVTTEIFSWGSGTNYQLGTGNAHLQKLPCKLDELHGSLIKLVSASKFHSVAVTGSGELYTWGFGRGGRLGHPEFDIHRYIHICSLLFPLHCYYCLREDKILNHDIEVSLRC